MPDRGAKSMLEQRPLLLLIDGPALVHRGWHAIREPLNVSRTGEEVRAVYGFMNTFLRYLDDWNPTHCAIAFDPKGPTFRHDQYAEYKAHRPSMPPELRPQFGHVRRHHGAVQCPHLRGALLRSGRCPRDAVPAGRGASRSRPSC